MKNLKLSSRKRFRQHRAFLSSGGGGHFSVGSKLYLSLCRKTHTYICTRARIAYTKMRIACTSYTQNTDTLHFCITARPQIVYHKRRPSPVGRRALAATLVAALACGDAPPGLARQPKHIEPLLTRVWIGQPHCKMAELIPTAPAHKHWSDLLIPAVQRL